MKVLIVDDEKLIVDDLTYVISEVAPKACVDGTINPQTALKLAEKNEYNVALVDIDIPGTNGITLARQLITMHPSINIIFVTGHPEYALQAHELYCSAFLVKPIGAEELKKAFDNLRNPVIDVPEDFFEKHFSGSDVIGYKLEFYRQQRNLSRQELATLMGVTRQTIYRWEHGERLPDIITFVKLARLLGVSMEDII